jgi:hypothetical protein
MERHTGTTAEHGDNPDVRHETSDINIRAVFGFAAGLFVTAVVIHGLIWLLFLYFDRRHAVRDDATPPLAVGTTRLPPEPRLQTNPRQDLQDLRESEERTLTTYGWVDRNGGTVRIPIDQAMKLTVERGLPTRQRQEGAR